MNEFGRPVTPLFSRWSDKVLVDDGCWEWQAGRGPQGYGAIRIPTKTKRAHRVSYELFRGPIPDGLLVCHHCDNPGCVKPSHLFVGTTADNMHDRDRKGRGNQRGGEQHPNAKLSGEDVLVIRELCESGSLQKVVADRFGVTFQEISKIVTRKIWKSL